MSSYTRTMINDLQRGRAIERSARSKVFARSHYGRIANSVGYLGEVVFEDWCAANDIEYQYESNTVFDYRVAGITVDVKTKARTVFPKSHFDNSIPAYNHDHQRPDYFVFVSLLRDEDRLINASLVGAISYEDMDSNGTHWKEGEIDKSNNNKFNYDTINVPMGMLTPMRDMVPAWAIN